MPAAGEDDTGHHRHTGSRAHVVPAAAGVNENIKMLVSFTGIRITGRFFSVFS